jgi:hypothetical protein
MRNLSRKALKWSTRILVASALFIIIWFSIPAFPHPFFPHRYQYEYCTVYSDSVLTSDFQHTIQHLNKRLEANDLHDPGKNTRIFLSHSRRLFGFYARICLLNPSIQGFNLSLFGNTFISVQRVKDMFERTGGFPGYGIRDGDMAHVLAHEITHQYIKDEIGYIKNYRLAPWKREGYAEYGANIGMIREDSTASLKNRIEAYLNNRYWENPGSIERDYYKSELMVEFLSEIKGYNLTDIMDDSVKHDETFNDMLVWYKNSD